MIQIFRLTIWLVASCWVLAAKAEQPSDLLGIKFGPSGNEEQQQQQQEQQQQLQQQRQQLQQQLMEPLDQQSREAIKRALFLRELDLDGSFQARPLSNKELRRRARLNELLDAISARVLMAPNESVSSSSASTAPIHRSGRTLLSRENSSNENYRNFRQLWAADQQQQQQQLLKSPGQRLQAEIEQLDPDLWHSEGARSGKGRKSGILGIVWPHDRPLSSSGTPPFYLDLPSAPRLQRKIDEREAAALSTAYLPAMQERVKLLASEASHEQQPRSVSSRRPQLQHQQQHHRSGTEEVALHTPVHSQSQSDYEWKREEQSRWNNLRGMWGKRAAFKSDENLLQKYKDLIEADSQPAAAAAGERGQESDNLAPALDREQTIGGAAAAM